VECDRHCRHGGDLDMAVMIAENLPKDGKGNIIDVKG
jgi:hypothetical protein